MTLYFTYESRDTLKSFTLFITVKTFTKLNLGHSHKLEIIILKISRRGSRSPDNAEFGHFTCFFLKLLNRDLTQNPTATATKTSLNKKSNEKNNGSAHA